MIYHNRFFNRIITSLLLLQLILPSSAIASPFTYSLLGSTAQTSLKTTIAVNKLGPLAVPSGQIVFEGNEIEVLAVPEGLFDQRTILSGVMISSQPIPETAPQAIRGLAYFFGGPWLSYLSLPPTFEVVSKTDGTIITGQVVGGDEKSLSLHKTNGDIVAIEFVPIANIESPRAFSFFLPVLRNQASTSSFLQGQTASIRFTSSNGGQRLVASKRIVSPLLGDEQGIKKSQILSFLAMDLFWTIAPAIVAPLVINNKNNRTASSTSFKANATSGLP